jgi:hypothetical protein
MRRQTGGDAGGLGRGGQKAGLKEAFDAEIVAEIGEGREGKQADGSSKTREVKLLTIWTAEVRDEEGTPVRDPGSVSDSAAIESAAQKDTDAVPSEFAARVQREATRRGFDRAQRRVVLGDGAPWIWKLAGEQFPDAIQIVDLFHAKGHLWDVAKAIYGAGSDLGKPWAKQRRDELDEGKIDAILAALRVHAEANDEARKCLGYVTTNRHRMRYLGVLRPGLYARRPESSRLAARSRSARGSSAAACTGPSPGPTRSSPCAAAFSGRFEDFWARRSAAATGSRRVRSSHKSVVRPLVDLGSRRLDLPLEQPLLERLLAVLAAGLGSRRRDLPS